MTFDVSRVRLGDVCEIKQGRYLAPGQMNQESGVDGDVPVIGGNGILGYTTSPTYDFDVPLVTCRGSRCGLMQWGASPSWISNNAMAVWFKHGKGDNRFLFHYLRQANFDTVITGSAQPQITVTNLATLELSIPEPRVQTAIANLMDDLERSISTNQNQSSLLEQIAQTIFKSWFVDFDPVHAKARGEQPEGMDAETAALFPDSFEDSELGSIPAGFHPATFESFAEVLLGGTPSKTNPDYWDGSIPWINSGAINNFRIIEATRNITELGLQKSSCKLLPKGTTVLAITGATLGQFSRVEIETTANQSVIGIRPFNNHLNDYVYLWVSENIGQLIAKATGGAQQHINRNDVCEQLVLLPSAEISIKFSESVSPLFELISNLFFQNQSLSKIRDSLLPRLISGELEIPEELLGD